MFSQALSIWGRAAYVMIDGYSVANHTLPLTIAETQRQPFKPITDGPIFKQWNAFAALHAKERPVQLVHGTFSMTSISLGNFFYKKSPKVVAVDIGLEYLDPKAARWFCKREFAHIDHNDSLKKFVPLLISSIAASVFCKAWYSPLLIGSAVHCIAEKTIGAKLERIADDAGTKSATRRELEGAVRFFTASIQADRELYLAHPFVENAVQCSMKLLDPHSCDHKRLAKIETALKSRFHYTDSMLSEVKKSDRVNNLRKYLVFRATTPINDPKYASLIKQLNAEALRREDTEENIK